MPLRNTLRAGAKVVMKNGAIPDVFRRKKEEFMKAIGY
jgi:hypothetical protein